MVDRDIDELEAIYNAANPGTWAISHFQNSGDPEAFAITANNGLDTICVLEEGEPGDFDDDARKQIAADFAFIAAARKAIPELIAEVRRLRTDKPFVVSEN